jgi:glycosyltransferase involved in cell wall biosynthesis
LKILHVNTIDTGGAAIAAIRLHKLLLSKGIESKILFLYRSGKTDIEESYYFEDLYKNKKWFKFLVKLNIIYNRRYSFYKPNVYFNGPDSLFNISKHPLFHWAEIVHLHWVVKFLDWGKVFHNKSKQFVWTLHDMNPFTGGEHYKTGYNNEFLFASKLNQLKKNSCLENSNLKIVTPSNWMKTNAANSSVFNSLPITTIRNPIPSTIFYKKSNQNTNNKYNVDENKIKLLFVAENPTDVRKGFQLLLNALENIKGDEFQLLIIGNLKHSISIKVPFLNFGIISDPLVLSEIYNLADYYIIPSIEDNLPNTVSESLMCGTPVIGFEIGGIKEMICHGENGFLVINQDDLSRLISELPNIPKMSFNCPLELDETVLFNKFNDLYKS